MKFIEGFVVLIAFSALLIWASLNLVVNWLVNGLMLVFGVAMLLLDLLALLIWVVNWKYYPEK